MRNAINRRDFLKLTGAAGAGLGLLQYGSGALRAAAPAVGATGANGKLTMAVVGTNGRGLAHIECLTGLPNVEIAYICDVDERAVASGIKATIKQQKNEPKGAKDIRKVLEDQSLDAITIATPDHWHAPMAILALAAGKHVYVEKPCSHNPAEGELLIQAVRKSGRLLQMGNQRRSFPTSSRPSRRFTTGSSAAPITGTPGTTMRAPRSATARKRPSRLAGLRALAGSRAAAPLPG